MRELIAAIVAAHPDFAAEVEGASPGELDELEGWIGRPLPDDYRAVLELMGRDLGRATPTWRDQPLQADLEHLRGLHRPTKANKARAGRRGRIDAPGLLQIATAPSAQDLGYVHLVLDDAPSRVQEVDADGEPQGAPVLLHRFFFGGPFRREVAKRLHALGLED